MTRRLLDVASFLTGAGLAAALIAGGIAASPIRKWGLW